MVLKEPSQGRAGQRGRPLDSTWRAGSAGRGRWRAEKETPGTWTWRSPWWVQAEKRTFQALTTPFWGPQSPPSDHNHGISSFISELCPLMSLGTQVKPPTHSPL